jgi:hypothetical protein
MKSKFIFLFLFLIITTSAEVLLRTYFGFCDTVLLSENPEFEYIAKPNQNRFRFRNTIKYNSFSMRSDEVDTSAYIILGFGDSVLNGGVLTDQDSLATTIISNTLSKKTNHKVQFLNISAGSWGPDNCYAYLEKYGNFNSKRIFLFVSSHDAFDNMNFEKIVGLNKNFPDEQYSLAIYELFDRYLFPRIIAYLKLSHKNELGINKKNNNSKFNIGFDLFQKYTKSNSIPFSIYLHAEKSELRKGKYNQQGQKIINFALENNINILTDIDKGVSVSDYRDNIHFNENGQKKMALIIISNIMNSSETLN